MITGLLTFFVLCYTVFIVTAIYSWLRLPEIKLPQSYIARTRISVLVAVRNEAENIIALLLDLEKQTFPKSLFEVILIDDFSEDDTSELIIDFQQKTDAKSESFGTEKR